MIVDQVTLAKAQYALQNHQRFVKVTVIAKQQKSVHQVSVHLHRLELVKVTVIAKQVKFAKEDSVLPLLLEAVSPIATVNQVKFVRISFAPIQLQRYVSTIHNVNQLSVVSLVFVHCFVLKIANVQMGESVYRDSVYFPVLIVL